MVLVTQELGIQRDMSISKDGRHQSCSTSDRSVPSDIPAANIEERCIRATSVVGQRVEFQVVKNKLEQLLEFLSCHQPTAASRYQRSLAPRLPVCWLMAFHTGRHGSRARIKLSAEWSIKLELYVPLDFDVERDAFEHGVRVLRAASDES